mgnify:CR=1 FL=1
MFNLPFYAGCFFLLIAVFLLVKKIQAKGLIEDSQAWPTATGRMLSSKATKYDSKRTRWDFIADYEYKVEGKSYKNNVAVFYTVSSKELAQSLAEEFPLNQDIKVYYNPSKPSQSVLRLGNGGRTENGEIIFALVFIAASLAIMAGAYFGFLTK